jgi:hypothetical protein
VTKDYSKARGSERERGTPADISQMMSRARCSLIFLAWFVRLGFWLLAFAFALAEHPRGFAKSLRNFYVFVFCGEMAMYKVSSEDTPV